MAFKKLVIASGQVSGASHSDFPILIQPSKMTGWEALTLAEAQSIRIYTDEAKTNEVAREVVSADEIHCKVPTLTSSTELYVDYDGVRSDLSPGATYGRNAVWGDYGGVWHMGDATTTTVTDSTSGGLTGTKKGVGAPTEVDGFIGKGQDFDRANGDYINVPHSSRISSDTDFTLQFGVYFNSFPDAFCSVINKRDNDDPENRANYGLQIRGGATDAFRVLYAIGTSFRIFSIPLSTNFSTGQWYKVQLNFENQGANTLIEVYKNGSLLDSDTLSGGVQTNTADLNMGDWSTDGSEPADVQLDEVRFIDPKRNDNWITTEYNNQNDVASFWGTVTDAGGDPPEPVVDTGFFAFM